MVQEISQSKRKKSGLSIAIYPLGLGGSNAERLEIEAMFSPPYNAASYGLSLTASPYQADVILLYGSLTEKIGPLVYNLLSKLPSDIKLIALGSEALTGAPFTNAYAVAGPFLDTATPTQSEITEIAKENPTSTIATTKNSAESVSAAEKVEDKAVVEAEEQVDSIAADEVEDSVMTEINEKSNEDTENANTADNVTDNEDVAELEADSEQSENSTIEDEDIAELETENNQAAEISAQSLADDEIDADEVENETIEPVRDDNEEISEAEIRVIDEPENSIEIEGTNTAENAEEPKAEIDKEPVVTVKAEVITENKNEAQTFTSPPQITKKGVPLPANLHLAGYIAGSPPDPQAILDGILAVITAKD